MIEWCASINSNAKTVEYLLENNADINAQDNKLQTSFMHASENGYFELAKNFIDKKADLNAQNKDQDSALILEVRKGYLKIMEYLIDNGAENDFIYSNKETVNPIFFLL